MHTVGLTGRRAVGVTPVAQEGMTVSITGSSGLIEFSQDQPYDIQDRDRQQRIPFQISEVGIIVQIRHIHKSVLADFCQHANKLCSQKLPCRCCCG